MLLEQVKTFSDRNKTLTQYDEEINKFLATMPKERILSIERKIAHNEVVYTFIRYVEVVDK